MLMRLRGLFYSYRTTKSPNASNNIATITLLRVARNLLFLLSPLDSFAYLVIIAARAESSTNLSCVGARAAAAQVRISYCLCQH